MLILFSVRTGELILWSGWSNAGLPMSLLGLRGMTSWCLWGSSVSQRQIVGIDLVCLQVD